MYEKNKNIAVLYALAAAVFYALNVPCSKLLLAHIEPTVMAAFLYFGAGFGVGIMYLFHRKKEVPSERLAKKDLPYTIGMILLDIIAPILLMIGVKYGTASGASLLGNFEIVATTMIAFILFREKISKKVWAAVGLITLASLILSFGNIGSLHFSIGSLFVLGATVCWGMENNCTKSISEKSTYQIVTIKGIGSGTGSLIAFRLQNIFCLHSCLDLLHTDLVSLLISALRKNSVLRKPVRITQLLLLSPRFFLLYSCMKS